MPAWPGGECPECKEQVPPNIVRCPRCRALLNLDLKPDSVTLPEFIPLQEVESIAEAEPRGFFVLCPSCSRELRVNRKYVGADVSCKHCNQDFTLDFADRNVKKTAFYANCPHCERELRASSKYLGMQAGCRHCGGKIQFVDSRVHPS